MPLAWPDSQPDPTKPNSKDADIRSTMLQEYSDHGNWGRHYSSVRMTLGTFFLTAATGMITLRWDKPELAVGVIAGAILLVGVAIFSVFSFLTFREMNSQFDIADSYRAKLITGTVDPIPRLKFRSLTGTGLPFVIFFVLAFFVFDGWWVFHSKPKPGQTVQIAVPMKVQAGQQPAVTVDVPITVTVP